MHAAINLAEEREGRGDFGAYLDFDAFYVNRVQEVMFVFQAAIEDVLVPITKTSRDHVRLQLYSKRFKSQLATPRKVPYARMGEGYSFVRDVAGDSVFSYYMWIGWRKKFV